MIYRFETCDLCVERRELRRDGQLHPIEPQVFDLLLFLIQNRTRVVTREEIFDTVWQGRLVSESVLGTRINAARAAIGDNGKEQRLIRTMRRKGLRFVAQVREEPQSAPAFTRAPMMSCVKSLSSSISGIPGLVVLPFSNVSGDPSNDIVADGLTEELVAALSKFGWFTVVSRDSAFGDKAPAITRELAKRLGVRYVLSGNVRQSESKLRIAVRLVDALANHQILSDGYDCDLRDIFALQDEITAQVVNVIADQLYAAESASVRVKTPESLTVWQCVLRAIGLINARKKSQVAVAERLLKQAVSIDPQCAAAISLLSFVTTLRVHLGWRSRTATVPTALRIAERAISLNAEEPWAYLALGYATIYRRPDEAIGYLEYALQLDPTLAMPHYLLALASSFNADCESAFKHADMADNFKSYDLLAHGNVGAHDNVRATACFVAGRYREGIEFARKVIKVNPRQTPAYRQLVLNAALAGEIEESAAALGVLRCLAPNTQQWITESSTSWTRREDYQKYVEAFRLAGLHSPTARSMDFYTGS